MSPTVVDFMLYANVLLLFVARGFFFKLLKTRLSASDVFTRALRKERHIVNV